MMQNPGRGVARGLDGPQDTGPQLQLWPQVVSSWKESMEVMSFLWTSTLLSVQWWGWTGKWLSNLSVHNKNWGGFGKNQLVRTHFLRFWLSRWGPRICILTSPSGGPDAGGPHLEKPISHVPSSSDNIRFYRPACECSRAMLPLHLLFPPGCTANLHFPAPLSQGLVLASATWTRMTCATFRPSLWNISHDLPLSLYPFSLATWTQMTQQRTPRRTGDCKDIR